MKTISIDTAAVQEPIVLDLDFTGIARYAAYLCVSSSGDQWVVDRVLENDGRSTDSRLDAFELAAPQKGKKVMLFATAQMTSPTPSGTVSMTGRVYTATGKQDLGSDTVSFDIKTGGYVTLELRIILVGT